MKDLTFPQKAHDAENTQPQADSARRRRIGYDPQAEPLSKREIEVLRLLCAELTNVEIGERLCLSPRTVETYRRTMMEKVGARNSVGLVLYALRKRIIDLGPPD